MNQDQLLAVYQTLKNHFGHRGWWPGETKIEIITGAILTQNTAWKNVEKAISNLKKENVLSYKGLSAIPQEELAERIRSSGYFNQKAKKIKEFISFLKSNHAGSVSRMFREETSRLREQLLSVNGIGPETADSILLYAGNHPVFVVDLYTYRVLTRHGWMEEGVKYEEMRRYFEQNLPRDVELYKDFHAQIVAVGNSYCRRTAKCEECPLKTYLPEGFLEITSTGQE